MWRRLMITAAAGGLVLAIALALATAVTFRHGHTIHVDRADGSVADQTVRFRSVRMAHGGIAVSGSTSHWVNASIDWLREPPPFNRGWVVEWAADPGQSPATYPQPWPVRTSYGFGWDRQSGPTSSSFDLVVPAAVPIVLLCMPAVVMAVMHRRRARRRSAHACLTCGYDLRATPGRCPECGRVAT